VIHRLFACTLASAVWLLAPPAVGQFTMYDFEQPWQFEDWTVEGSDEPRVEAAERFATSGNTSARLHASAGEQPVVFRLRLWDNNYEPYDRVAIDITNASDEPLRLTAALVSDHDNGYRFPITVPPLSAETIVQKIRLPEFIRHDNLHFLTLTAEAGQPVDAYVDQIVALREGEQADHLAEDQPGDELTALRRAALSRRIAELRGAIESGELGLPSAQTMMTERLDELAAQIDDGDLADDDTATLLDAIGKAESTLDRFVEIAGYVDAYDKPTDAGFVIGFADAMTKVMPKHLPTGLELRDELSLSVAGGEKEAVQVVVVPFAGDVRNANVTVSDLAGPGGAVLDGEQVNADLVAFVETTFKTTPDVEYVGWWPDPLIDTDRPVDVALGDAQPWWVRVGAARDQTPGEYTGMITVSAEGQQDVTFPLSVTVRSFNVPKHAPIPTAVTFVGHTFKNYPMFQDGGWEERKFAYTDMLNDYMMNMDSLYRWADPDRLDAVDWELIEYQKDKVTLVMFNLGYFYEAEPDKVKALRPYYEEAKRRGVLDHAYIYGWDETGPNTWPKIAQATVDFGEEFPGLFTMITSQDHSYGFNSPIKELGAWVPIISRYNPTLAEQARELGRKVWWYTCIWPPHPYPNVFVDYPAIENRVLTGLMHMKYQPDGFLYYATTMWPKPDKIEFITDVPYTDWVPESFPGSNGDGSYFCLTDDGTLVPTLRVENYRDGFEDLAYWMILEHQVKLYRQQERADGGDWLKDAQAALERVDALVPDRRTWPDNAQAIYAYRDTLAELIESSPIDDTDPWKHGIGVRGIFQD